MDTPNLCLARVRCLFVGLKLLHKRIRIILSYQTCSKRGFVTLADQSMRILAYRYQQGILAPQIPLGGGLLSCLSFDSVSSLLQELFGHFAGSDRVANTLAKALYPKSTVPWEKGTRNHHK